jgi:hypothetical protein
VEAVLVLAGGGRVRAGQVGTCALADVAEHEVSHRPHLAVHVPFWSGGVGCVGRGGGQSSLRLLTWQGMR